VTSVARTARRAACGKGRVYAVGDAACGPLCARAAALRPWVQTVLHEMMLGVAIRRAAMAGILVTRNVLDTDNADRVWAVPGGILGYFRHAAGELARQASRELSVASIAASVAFHPTTFSGSSSPTVATRTSTRKSR
jgi:hypothetical protein